MKPVIGISMNYEDGKNTLHDLYSSIIIAAGGLPLLIPNTPDAAVIRELSLMCDGFLFTGGADVEPSYYGEERLAECGESIAERDRAEFLLFDLAYESGKPILGICRGMQLINVALGGALYQDVNTAIATSLLHTHDTALENHVPQHGISVICDTPLYALVGESMGVNSFHHQAVKRLGRNLLPMALAPDGVIEAFYMPGERYVLGLQWHPERMYFEDDKTRKIIKEFIDAATAAKN